MVVPMKLAKTTRRTEFTEGAAAFMGWAGFARTANRTQAAGASFTVPIKTRAANSPSSHESGQAHLPPLRTVPRVCQRARVRRTGHHHAVHLRGGVPAGVLEHHEQGRQHSHRLCAQT